MNEEKKSVAATLDGSLHGERQDGRKRNIGM